MRIQIRFMAIICRGAATMFADRGPGPGGSGAPSTKQVALFIPNEAAPPGGLVQMKFMVTEPTPISTGKPILSYDSATFDGVWGIELFCATGDVNGVALIDGQR